jgi:small-conductance mechanosensitive channel
MPNWSTVWQFTYLDNSVHAWALALGALVVILTLLPLIRGYVSARRRKWQPQEMPISVEFVALLVARTSRLFHLALAGYVAERFLELPPQVERASTVLFVLVFWLQAGLWAVAATRFAIDQHQRRRGTADPAVAGSFDIILAIARFVIFAIVALLALDNLGVNITALVAGLGIGGIAVALAVQAVLGDVLASLSITLDKPFRIGDTLRIEDYEGVVEHIGIKSTRMRSVSGEQIILSNTDVLKSRVRNLGRMPERRALFTLSLSYETPREKLDAVPRIVADAVRVQPHARFEYCLLRSFGEWALQYEVCYFFDNREPRLYLETLDAVNRRLLGAFEDAAIRFAYPTRSVLLREEAPRAPDAARAARDGPSA